MIDRTLPARMTDFYKANLEEFKRKTGWDLVTAAYVDADEKYYITKQRNKWTCRKANGEYITVQASTLTQCKIMASKVICAIEDREAAEAVAAGGTPTIATVDFTVYAVRDPKTGNTACAVTDDPSNIVQICLDGYYFESEAYHLVSWCRQHGLVLAARDQQEKITV